MGQVVSRDFFTDKHCSSPGVLKPRRPMPHITIPDLIDGLHMTDARWIFKGMLNGWPL